MTAAWRQASPAGVFAPVVALDGVALAGLRIDGVAQRGEDDAALAGAGDGSGHFPRADGVQGAGRLSLREGELVPPLKIHPALGVGVEVPGET